MRLISLLPALLFYTLFLAGCSTAAAVLPDAVTPDRIDPRERPFRPRSDYPIPPNVDSLIGPEDCQGSQLAAQQFELPDYPVGAYARGLQGWVVVRFHVYDTGNTHRVRVARSVPSGRFDGTAVEAVENWRFQNLPEGTALTNCVVLFEFRMGQVRIR